MIWFAPLPPLSVDEGRPFIGAEDFIDLFNPDAPWAQAANRIHVFKLYGEWVGTDPWNVHASDAELQQAVADLNRRGIALAMEAGPLEPTSTCGQGIEGFGGPLRSGIRDARRIKAAGGTLSFIALDEPFAFASIYDGPQACQWSPERVAREVGAYIQGMRTIFPDLIVGDTEPLWRDVDVEDYKNWLRIFREVNGYDLAFFHLDVDFGRADWPEAAKELEDFARGWGIEFGIIYMGDGRALTDEAWLISAGERVKTYELITGGQPDHVLFQSWTDHPDRTLPETEPYTFTWFVNAYFEDKPNLGVRTEGPGANVGYGKSMSASRSAQSPAEKAVDGNTETFWGAGDFAPQWIEVDLGESYTIAELRLLVGQSPDGETVHQVLVRGPGTRDAYEVLHTFSGVTLDLQWLTLTMSEPVQGIRYVRIETKSSPSWVSWGEIEVISAE
ncbi:MAG TPA: discoidin domain-containing protein [Anaerolineae bacterium]|nr:discoidin domain-containing protein [Anaerolineae bacterium]